MLSTVCNKTAVITEKWSINRWETESVRVPLCCWITAGSVMKTNKTFICLKCQWVRCFLYTPIVSPLPAATWYVSSIYWGRSTGAFQIPTETRNLITRELTLCVLYSAWGRDSWFLKCGTDLKVIQISGGNPLLGNELRLLEEEKDDKRGKWNENERSHVMQSTH